MPNPTIYVTLASLDPGTQPTVTGSVHVPQGGNLDVNATWPAGTDTITCDLKFNADSQDPMNDETGGDTQFNMTRASASVAAVYTLSIESDATTTSDTYELTLTINGNSYSTDPMIIVDDD